MQASTSSQNIKDALQRLLDGLQRTLQVFKVFNDDDVERGNIQEESCKQVSGDTQPPLCQKNYGFKHSPMIFDRKDLQTGEKELGSYDYEFETDELRFLPAETLRARTLKDKICGPSGNVPSFVEQWPGVKTSVIEQELYTTSIHEQQNPFKKTEVFSKQPAKKNLFSKKNPTCSIEETELSDKIIVWCKQPDGKATGKGDDRDVNPLGGELIRKVEEEPEDVMESCHKNEKHKGSRLFFRRKRPKQGKAADPHDCKNCHKGDVTQEGEEMTIREEKKQAGKGGCCKACTDCFQGGKKKKGQKPRTPKATPDRKKKEPKKEADSSESVSTIGSNRTLFSKSAKKPVTGEEGDGLKRRGGKGHSRKPRRKQSASGEKSREKSIQIENSDTHSPSETKERSTVIGFDTGNPIENSDGCSKKKSARKGEKVKEYYFKPKKRKPKKGKQPSQDRMCHADSTMSVGARSAEKSSERSSPSQMNLCKKRGELQPDFILVFLNQNYEELGQILAYYLENLERAGLLVESVTSRNYKDFTFIKVQIPKETTLNLAQLYDIKLACINPYYEQERSAQLGCLNTNLTSRNPKTQIYIRNRESVKGAQPKEPTSAERIMVLYEVLKVAQFSDELDDFGVEQMKRQNIIAAAYPLHDGEWEWSDRGPLNDRQLLKEYWGTIAAIYKKQPIQHIKKYFGPEAGFYFALTGVYITMLIPLAVVGLIPIIYGFLTMDNSVISSYCTNDTVMCPYCKHPSSCDYTTVKGSCYNSKIIHVFDNKSTMIFAMATSIWSILFITRWRIRENNLKVGWNLHQCFEADLTLRPRYYMKAQQWAISPITNEEEPHVTKSQQWFTWAVSVCGMIIIVLVVLLTLFLIILYRIALLASVTSSDVVSDAKGSLHMRGRAVRIAALMAALLSSGITMIFSPLFDVVAIFLTNIENPRTQTEFDQSCTVKMFFFSCINHYTMAFYLAFFRSMGYTNPGDVKMWDSFFGINADICDAAGCLIDVIIFITTIIIFKALMNLILTIVIPCLQKVHKKTVLTSRPWWEIEYDVKSISNYYFTKLNIELITQYGFVIFFIPAFPLLPLLVLICNILEVRINAQGLVRYRQRPVPNQKCHRETWNDILYTLTFIGIIVNGFVAGFASDYVERETYSYQKTFPMDSYAMSTVTSFKTENYVPKPTGNVPICYYTAKRNSTGEYRRSSYYFQVIGTRLNVVIVVVGLVLILDSILFSIVPTIRYSTKQKVNYLEKKEIF